jgi:hypothetical protein
VIELRLMTDEETGEWMLRAEITAQQQAVHDRLLAECVAKGGHLWELELPLDDEWGGPADLRCATCPAGMDDLYPDGHDMLYGEFYGIAIDAGRHDATEPLVVPVDASVRSWTSWTGEYDAEIQLSQRGPAYSDNLLGV